MRPDAGDRSPLALSSPLTRRRLLQHGGGLAVVTVFPTLLAACGGDDSSSGTGTTSGGGGDAPSIGGTIRWLGFEGEDGERITTAWRRQNDVTIQPTFMAAQDDILNALTIGTPLDLVAPFNGYISVLDKAGVLQPFDLEQVPNFDDLFPVLKDAEWLRSSDGAVLGVPIVWGDGPYIYRPERIPGDVPESVLDLADPVWRDQLVWLDDPYTTIHGFAKALGFEEPTELTPEQLDEVARAAEPVMANVVSIAASFGDATDLLVRGDASLAPIGWRVMVSEGARRDVELVAGAFRDLGVAFCDCYALPSDAENVATAQAYANEMISPRANAELAASLQSGAVTEPAYELLDRADQELYDYALVRDPDFPVKIVNSLPPSDPPAGITSSRDWQQTWNELKSA